MRPDGRVATRNYIRILTTVNGSATVVKTVAARFQRGSSIFHDFPNVDGVVALTHGSGCPPSPISPASSSSVWGARSTR